MLGIVQFSDFNYRYFFDLNKRGILLTMGSDNYSMLLMNKSKTTVVYRPVDALYELINKAQLIIPLKYPLAASNPNRSATDVDQAFYVLQSNFDQPMTVRFMERFEDHYVEYLKLIELQKMAVFAPQVALLVVAVLALLLWAVTVNSTSKLARKPFSMLALLRSDEIDRLATRCRHFLAFTRMEGQQTIFKVRNDYNTKGEGNDESYEYDTNEAMQPSKSHTSLRPKRNSDSVSRSRGFSSKQKKGFRPIKSILEKDKIGVEEIDLDQKISNANFNADSLYIIPLKSDKTVPSPEKLGTRSSKSKKGRKPTSFMYHIAETELADMVSQRHLIAPIQQQKPIPEQDPERLRRLLNYKSRYWLGFLKFSIIALLCCLPWMLANFLLDVNFFVNFSLMLHHMNQNIRISWIISRMTYHYIRIPATGAPIRVTVRNQMIDYQVLAENRMIELVKDIAYEDRSMVSSRFSGYFDAFQEVVDKPLCICNQMHNMTDYQSVLAKSPTRNCTGSTTYGLVSTITLFVKLEKDLVEKVMFASDPKAQGQKILQNPTSLVELDNLTFTLQNTLAFLWLLLQEAVEEFSSYKSVWSWVICYGSIITNLAYFLFLHRRYIAGLENDVFRTRSLVNLIPFKMIMNSHSLYTAIENE